MYNGRRSKKPLESKNEGYLVKAVAKMGGKAPKLTCMGMSGFPDRMILLPYGIVSYAEVKRPGEKPRPKQVERMSELAALGFDVWWADNTDEIDRQLQRLGNAVTEAQASGKSRATIVQGTQAQIRPAAVFRIVTESGERKVK